MLGIGKRVRVLVALGGVVALATVALGGVALAQAGGGTTSAIPSAQHDPGAGVGGAVRTCLQSLRASTNGQLPTGAALATALKPCLDTAVSTGKLTATQETTILTAITNGKGPFAGHHGPGTGAGGAVMACLQSLRGSTTGQLPTGAALATALKPCLDTAVSTGKLTAAQEATLLAAITNGKGPFAGRRGPGTGAGGAMMACFTSLRGSTSGQLPTGAALATALKPCLDTAVSSGKLTAAQETKLLAAITNGKSPFWHHGV